MLLFDFRETRAYALHQFVVENIGTVIHIFTQSLGYTAHEVLYIISLRFNA